MATTAVPAEAPPEDVQPVGKGKKRLIIIAAAAALVMLLVAGGGTFWWLSKKDTKTDEDAEQVDAGEAEEPAAEAKVKKKKDDKKHIPVFLPLEAFTVNLADRESERYAQVGITLEVSDAKTSDLLKAYMPAIRNDILMVLAHKKASELQERSGKLALSREVRRAALKALGEEHEGDADDESPVRAVHFSSFIIQ